MPRLSAAFVLSICLFSAFLLACSGGSPAPTSEVSLPDSPASGTTSGPVPTPTLEPMPALTAAPTPTATPIPTPTFDELKAISAQISYEDLFRNNEIHVGKQVWYTGNVIQVIEEDNGKYALRVNVTKGDFGWEDTVLLWLPSVGRRYHRIYRRGGRTG